MNIDFHNAERLMHEAVAQGTFPGAVLLVSREEGILLHRAFGMADLFHHRPMTCDTVFDLASLTKPLATALAVMLLVQQGRISLDRPCQFYWPRFNGPGKEKITVRHLLSHCSGLPAWRPYYLHLSGSDSARREALRRTVLAEPLSAVPGERSEYSDIGFLVLQWMIEHMVGRTLDRFVEASVYQPLGIDSLFFCARSRPVPRRDYAATELCPLRGRLLNGEVHDDNAHLAGGVAGHAGLFGTAGAVWTVLHGLLSAEAGHQSPGLFESGWVRHFFERQGAGSWALGFDTPADKESSAGSCFSAGSVGHLGYTGTSFWMDRTRGIIVILLSNRVHPSRYNTCIKAFRPRLHDAVMGALLAGR
ncbi:MAG: class A beta-lactamase-related serine hydrolase [Desulfobacteraceae bacterium]|nr:MAG: class A beta-lactamase-related serine hydrolase [Desulfobacteraceae bacterium]